MKIIPLGVGSAFTMNDYQSNLLIERNGKKLLIDAGTDIRFSLSKQGLTYKDIDAVYISHLHADHAGGVEYLAFTTYFDPTKEKMRMFGHSKVLINGWNHTWSGGLLSLQCTVADLEGFFTTKPLTDNGSFMWEGIHFDIVQSVHNINGYSIVHSYGLMIHEATSTKKIFFTSDTQHNPNQIKDFYNQADLIIQDCETAPYMSGVHAHYNELKTLDENTKKKMMLIHYQNKIKSWKEDGFKGFCEAGKEII